MAFIQTLFAAAAGGYDTAAGWDISTASLASTNTAVTGSGNVAKVTFNSAGTSIYVGVGGTTDATSFVAFSPLSTAYDLSTANTGTWSNSNWPNDNSSFYYSRGVSYGLHVGGSCGLVMNYDKTTNTLTTDNTLYYTYNSTTYWSNNSSTPPFSSFKFAQNGMAFITVPYASASKTSFTIKKVTSAGNYASAYDAKTFDFTGTVASGGNAFLSNDGRHVFITSSQTIYQFFLSIAFDATTASFVRSLDLSSDLGAATIAGIDFKPDGTSMLVLDSAFDLRQYTLS